MPVLLLLITAILQFGPMYSNYSAVVDAARTGVRTLSIDRGLSDPCDPAVNQTIESMSGVATLTASEITPSFTSESASNTTADACGTNNGSTCTYQYDSSCNTNGNENQNDEATVTVTEPYTLSVLGMKIMTVHLSSSSSEPVE
jgi:TadE-like protein